MPDLANVLLITADQLRSDALGCYGNPICRTPNLDAIAAAGAIFRNSYSSNPVCVPARATITTGNYSHVCTGTKSNGGRIKDSQPKLAEHFVANGYETYACGKLHYVPYSPPGEPRLLHGFQHCDLHESGRLINQFDPKGAMPGLEDYMDYLADVGWAGYSRAHGIGNNDVRPCANPLPAEHCPDHWVADMTIKRLREHSAERAEKPFLIWCSFPKPHSPYDPPLDYANLYDPRELPPPAGGEADLDDRNPSLAAERVTRAMDLLSPAALQVIKSHYYGLITFQDAQIGRIMEALEAAGAADDTIVIYTADHGDMMGDFGMFFKGNFLRGSVDVPMVIKGPAVPAGGRREQLVGLQDVLPTLTAMTGCPLDQAVHGLDLTAACQDPDAPTRELYFSHYANSPHQVAMVTDGRMKYCYAEWGATEELYDHQDDPQELVNLAARPDAEGLLAGWREKLIAEARRWGDTDLLDGDGLAASPLDRSAFADLPVRGMGWRWY